MLPRKLSESLTARVFLITLLILLSAGAVTFGLIAWATPSTYTAVVTDDLTAQVDQLVDQLDGTEEQSCGPLLDQFIRTSGAEAMLVGPDGRIANTGSQLAVQPVYEDSSLVITSVQGDSTVTYDAGTSHTDDTVAVTMSEQAAITAEVRFAGQEDSYTLYVTPRMEAENLAVRALAQMAPWILLVLLIFSLLCALVYSRYITRPIVRLSGIAGKMAQLDFQWESGEKRRDEIGRLGRSLDQMARKLSAALTDLEGANRALRGEVERERELDRQRMAFFNAASHELKTPVTILKGQLSGMLEGVGVYQDRDKYLLRSLQTTGRMENLIGEMLAISRMESGAAALRQETVDLSALTAERLQQDGELFRQREQELVSALTPGVLITGDPSLLGRAVGNLLSNALKYTSRGGTVCVHTRVAGHQLELAVTDTGIGMSDQEQTNLFTDYYRTETARNSDIPGHGIGLSLTRRIVVAHGGQISVSSRPGEGSTFTIQFGLDAVEWADRA